MASGPFKYLFGALMWLCSTLKEILLDLKKKWKEFMKHMECSDVLVECQ